MSAALAPRRALGYTDRASQSCGAGFDSLIDHCDESRSLARPAAFLLCAPVLGGTNGKPQGLPTHSSGHRSVNPFVPPPLFDSKAAVHTTDRLEANMAQTALVPVFTGTLSNASVQLCNARDLHAFMAVLRDFSNWIKGRIRKFGFIEGVDFLTVSRPPELASGNRGASIDYHLTLDMAKELSMVENNTKGREARRYFIDCEKATHPAPAPYSVAPGQTLSAEQADTLRGLLTSFAESMPKDLRASIMIQGWSKLKAHFKADYRHIPAAQFTEAVSILGRHIAHWAPADPQKTLIGLPAPTAEYTPTLRGRRWVISVDWEGKEYVTPVADGAMIYTWEQVLRRVAINDELPKGFLLELANAAMSALYKANQDSATPRQKVLS